MSLFFAYTKPKLDPRWPGAEYPQFETCPTCLRYIEVGSWPFCPHDEPKTPHKTEREEAIDLGNRMMAEGEWMDEHDE